MSLDSVLMYKDYENLTPEERAEADLLLGGADNYRLATLAAQMLHQADDAAIQPPARIRSVVVEAFRQNRRRSLLRRRMLGVGLTAAAALAAIIFLLRPPVPAPQPLATQKPNSQETIVTAPKTGSAIFESDATLKPEQNDGDAATQSAVLPSSQEPPGPRQIQERYRREELAPAGAGRFDAYQEPDRNTLKESYPQEESEYARDKGFEDIPVPAASQKLYDIENDNMVESISPGAQKKRLSKPTDTPLWPGCNKEFDPAHCTRMRVADWAMNMLRQKNIVPGKSFELTLTFDVSGKVSKMEADSPDARQYARALNESAQTLPLFYIENAQDLSPVRRLRVIVQP